MKRGRRPFLGVLAAALLVGQLSGCGLWEEHHWRQKVIVEVETPQGLVTGSSVQAVEFSRARFSVPAGPSKSFTPTGEAVVVDLGPAGVLFALLKGVKAHGDAGRLAPIAFHGLDTKEGYSSEIAIKKVLATPIGSRAPLPKNAYPMLVTFSDVNDPKSVKQVDPSNLEAAFGAGFSLRSISIEMTEETVTGAKVEKALFWLTTIGDGMLDGSRISTIAAKNRLANDLSRLDFKRN